MATRGGSAESVEPVESVEQHRGSPQPTAGEETLAERVAREVWAARRDGLPEAVLRQAVVHVVDTIGVALAGAGSTAGDVAARVAADTPGGGGGATIWATGGRVGARDAALANGAAAHALDYDDSSADTVTHTGAIAVPVGLALGEEQGSSAREVLSAIACGYQVADFIEGIAHHEFQANGFHSAAMAGLFGGVTVAACLGKGDERTLADAYGIAGSMASGLMEFLIVGGDTKPLQVGWAAHGAIVAAQMAALGARGPRTVLEGRYGLYASYLDKQLTSDVVRTAPLWGRYAMLRNHLKPYPVCQGIHASADAWTELAAALRARGGDPLRDVVSVHCEVPDFTARLVLDPLSVKRRPQTDHAARFSLPYCLARIALDGALGLASFGDEKLHDERAHAFMDRVTYSVSGDGDPRLATVRVDCGALGVLTKAVGPPVGEPYEWMPEARRRAKFLDAGATLATEEELVELYETASGIYETNDLAPLFAGLSGLSRR